MKIREDQVLFMFSDALKTIANDYKIHIDSATQLSGDYKNAQEKDQTILRGSTLNEPVIPYLLISRVLNIISANEEALAS